MPRVPAPLASLAVLGLALAVVPSAKAILIWDNGPADRTQIGLTNVAGNNATSQLEDFAVPFGPMTRLTRVEWSQHDSPDFVYSSTTLGLYSDAGDLFNFSGQFARRTPNGSVAADGFIGYDYSIDFFFVTAVTGPAGSVFRIGLNNRAPVGSTRWDFATPSAQAIPGGYAGPGVQGNAGTARPGDLTLRVFGEQMFPVPEPGSIALLGLGVMGLVAVRAARRTPGSRGTRGA